MTSVEGVQLDKIHSKQVRPEQLIGTFVPTWEAIRETQLVSQCLQ